MIWLTWRQFRVQALVISAVLAILAAVLLVSRATRSGRCPSKVVGSTPHSVTHSSRTPLPHPPVRAAQNSGVVNPIVAVAVCCTPFMFGRGIPPLATS